MTGKTPEWFITKITNPKTGAVRFVLCDRSDPSVNFYFHTLKEAEDRKSELNGATR